MEEYQLRPKKLKACVLPYSIYIKLLESALLNEPCADSF